MVALKQAAMLDERFERRLQDLLSADAEHLISRFEALPDPKPDPRLQASAFRALLEEFAYTWLVVNPAEGRTISDDEAIDVLTNLLHHGMAGGR
ncbi:MAG TPA: hypothetical protein VIL71_09515 [Spirillospora sp.]